MTVQTMFIKRKSSLFLTAVSNVARSGGDSVAKLVMFSTTVTCESLELMRPR